MLEEPEDREPGFAALVCHPHPLFGGTMHNKVVYRLARGLRRAGAVVLRFNFRGVGSSAGEHGHLEGEIEDARAALVWLRERYPTLPHALAGFSFGSRVVTRLGCETASQAMARASCWPPVFQRAGAHPSTCMPARFPRFSSRAHTISTARATSSKPCIRRLREPKEIHWIESSDHFFAGGLDALEATVASVAR